MSDAIKIINLQLENVKRVRAVELCPVENGLTVIGGQNAAGKTSIIDALAYLLGGEKYRPSDINRDGALSPATMRLELSNGLTVERKGKNAALTVTDPSGKRAGQTLLDSFVEELAINLPRFLAATAKKKADVLLQILGIGEQLAKLEAAEEREYEERTLLGRESDRKRAYADEQPYHSDAPAVAVSVANLVAMVTKINQDNAARDVARHENTVLAESQKIAERLAIATANAATDAEVARAAEHEELKNRFDCERREIMEAATRAVEALKLRIDAENEASRKRIQAAKDAANVAKNEAARLAAIAPINVEPNQDPTAITEQLKTAEDVNAKVRDNAAKKAALEAARLAEDEYRKQTQKIEAIRAERKALLDGAAMPLPGLSVEAGELTYKGKRWDCMATSEQIRAGAAIVRKLKPECGFILLDKLEALDTKQLAELATWLQSEGLQGIATRVSTGDECTIIIEDGLIAARKEV